MAKLQDMGEGVWVADGPVVAVLGFRYPTRMAVLQTGEGLVLWSPVPDNGALIEAVRGLGPVARIVSPTASHHLGLPDWTAAFPDAPVSSPAGLARKRPGLAVQEIGGWPEDLDHILMPNLIADEWVLFHRPSGSVLIADLIQHFPPGWFTGWRGAIARLDRMVAPRPEVPRKFRLALAARAAHRAASRAALAQMRGWRVRRLILAHGPVIEEGAEGVLEDAFRWAS